MFDGKWRSLSGNLQATHFEVGVNFLYTANSRAGLIALPHPLSVMAVLSLSLKYQGFISDNTRVLVVAKREETNEFRY